MAQQNILILMVDQLTGTLFPDGPADWLHTPNLRRLAEASTRFTNAYTASPLCAPGRASFMTGQLPRHTRVYDNAAEFASDIPTYAHLLRRAGYRTCLSGKMHFVGPDQLHGFEERLTTDVYPADFGWTPDYTKPGERIDWWYHNMGSVTGAGVAEISNQLEYDDEVAYHALRKIYDYARGERDAPWCLTVSFTHPHDPYVARREYWDLYKDCAHLMPDVAAMDYDAHDPHSKRIFDANDWRSYDISDEDIRRSRRAYFANISYIDAKIGTLLDALERTDQSATILFVSDHGDMLGERGLWFKMNFFEGSARVPLMVSDPSLPAGRIDTPVSTMDVLPTLTELAGASLNDENLWLDGESLVHVAEGQDRSSAVPMEYAAEASLSPIVGLRSGPWKYIKCLIDPPMLFNLADDPQEQTNLADDPRHADLAQQFERQMREIWDLQAFDAEVRQSQARRLITYDALRNGAYFPWDFQPLQKASERYMRNHLNLDDLESRQRYPKEPSDGS